jgi:anaerobic magnesium-protoporphyrin IX monomethyl ester cyclase
MESTAVLEVEVANPNIAVQPKPDESPALKRLNAPPVAPKRIAFAQNITDQLLGFAHMAACLTHRGHAVKAFVENFEKDMLEALKEFKPDVLGVQCLTGNDGWYLKLMREYKKIDPNCLVVAGGPHCKYHPDSFIGQGIDAICTGEGDLTILDLTELWDGSIASLQDIENIWLFEDDKVTKGAKAQLIEQLDDFPLTDRTIYDHYKYYDTLSTMPIMATRGCPFACTYCYMNAERNLFKGLGKFVRYRSPDNLIAEINEMKARYKKLRFIVFEDSTLNLKRNWFNDLMGGMAEKAQLPFFAHLRADIVTEAQLDGLQKAGCHLAALGVESGSERLRKDVLKRPMTDDQIMFTVNGLRDRNIKIGTANMFGVPSETLEESYGLIRLNQKIKAELISSTVFNPYPGTDLADFAYDHGFTSMSSRDVGNYYHDSPVDQPDIKKQIRLQKLLYYYTHLPRLEFLWEFMVRYAPFKLLCWMLYAGIVFSIKSGYGYSWANIIYYGMKNFKLYSKD